MRTRVLALSLLLLVLVVSPIAGSTAAQSTTTTAPNATTSTGNNSTNATVNRTVSARPTVDPYGQDYLNKTGKYNSNNSTLGVYNNSTGMQESGGGMMYNALLDGFVAIVGHMAMALLTFVDALLDIVVKMVTVTPAPEWGGGWYQNPDNGIWPQRYADWTERAQPWTLFICIMSTGLYLALGRRGMNLLPARYERQGTKNLIVAWIAGLWGWQLVGFILNIANALSFGIAQSVTDPTLLTSGLKGIMAIALLFTLLWNAWVLLAVVALVGLRFLGLTALTPWIPFLIALRAVPFRPLSMIGDGLTKLWAVLALMTLPVAIALSVGFSPVTAEVYRMNGMQGIQIMVLQLATAIGCLVFPYFMFSKGGKVIGGLGVAGAAPTPEGMKESYANQRQRAGEIKESTKQTVTNARDTHRGLRGADPVGDGGSGYATGQAGRQTFQTYTQPINQRIDNMRGGGSIDKEAGAAIQQGLERHFPEDNELEQLRRERLNDIRNRLQD